MNKKLRSIFKQTVFALIIAAFMTTPIAEARGYENLSVDQLARMGIYFTKGDFSCGANSASATSGTSPAAGNAALNLTAHQITNAKAIIGIAKTYQLGKEGAIIGVMTAITESHLRTYASQRIPLSEQNPIWKALPPADKKSGKDHMSVGSFQQQVTTGWSTYGNSPSDQATVWQLMDIAYNAQAFFGTPPGSKLPADLKQPSALRKGVLNQSGDWKTRNPWVVAQDVQVSFDPTGGNYKKYYGDAVKIVDTYYDSAPAVPLPIPVNGGAAAPGAAANANGCPDNNTLSGTGVQKMMQTIAKYAWPDYCSSDARNCKNRAVNCPTAHNYCDTPNEMRKAYIDAVQAAKKKGEYVGSCNGVDCGGFVTRVMRDSGADPEYNKYGGNTAQQMAYLENYSDGEEHNHAENRDKPVRYHRIKDSEKLQSGDIAVQNNGSTHHTYIYVGKITGLDEKGTVVPFNGDVASSSQCGRAPMASSNDDRGKYEWFRLITK
jgi:hypothetical protein